MDQLPQRHPQDGVGLDGRERVVLGDAPIRAEGGKARLAQRPLNERRGALNLHQAQFRLDRRRRRADHADHFVDIRVGQEQALDDVLPLPRFGQQELRAAADHDDPMPQKLLEHRLERQNPRLAIH